MIDIVSVIMGLPWSVCTLSNPEFFKICLSISEISFFSRVFYQVVRCAEKWIYLGSRWFRAYEQKPLVKWAYNTENQKKYNYSNKNYVL